MAKISGLTKARMLEIEGSSVVSGFIDLSGNLILQKRDETTIDAGHVKGEQGEEGPPGPQGVPGPLITGVVYMYAGDETQPAPDNTFYCLGQEVSRIDDANLFAKIGTKYGGGDGTTTFNLPNFSGRTPFGMDLSQSEFNVRGKLGGTKTETLSVAQIPFHRHIFGADDQVSIQGSYNVRGNFSYDATSSTTGNGVHLATKDMLKTDYSSEAGGQSHNNLPPYITVNFIICR